MSSDIIKNELIKQLSTRGIEGFDQGPYVPPKPEEAVMFQMLEFDAKELYDVIDKFDLPPSELTLGEKELRLKYLKLLRKHLNDNSQTSFKSMMITEMKSDEKKNELALKNVDPSVRFFTRIIDLMIGELGLPSGISTSGPSTGGASGPSTGGASGPSTGGASGSFDNGGGSSSWMLLSDYDDYAQRNSAIIEEDYEEYVEERDYNPRPMVPITTVSTNYTPQAVLYKRNNYGTSVFDHPCTLTKTVNNFSSLETDCADAGPWKSIKVNPYSKLELVNSQGENKLVKNNHSGNVLSIGTFDDPSLTQYKLSSSTAEQVEGFTTEITGFIKLVTATASYKFFAPKQKSINISPKKIVVGGKTAVVVYFSSHSKTFINTDTRTKFVAVKEKITGITVIAVKN